MSQPEQKRPPMYFKWAQIDRICTCGRELGVHQDTFEKLIQENLDLSMTLQDARILALKTLGIKKMCCLSAMTFFPKNFICDTHENALVDITFKDARSAVNRNKIDSHSATKPGYEFLCPTKGQLEINMDRYYQKLNIIKSSSYNNIQNTALDNNTPKFTNFRVVHSQNYPAIKASIEPLSNEELTLANLI